mgnify:CR=1 FL=1
MPVTTLPIMPWRWLAILLLMLPLSLAAQDDEASPQLSPNSYANAVNILAPLRPVAGDPRPLDPTLGASPPYGHSAIEFAESTESYALLIGEDGELLVERYFEPFDEGLRANSASMHKTVVALLVAAAIADGHIGSPDDRVGDYIDAWADDPRGDIPLRAILTMASGLEPLSTEGGMQSPAVRYSFMAEDVRETTLTRPIAHKPGEVFHYTAVNTQLLVLVLESATGKPYSSYLSERLWQPLGASEALVWLTEKDGFPAGHTALLARAADWFRIGRLIKNRGKIAGRQIIPAHLIDEMTAPSEANPNYGWQIWLGTEYDAQRHYNEAKIGPAVRASEPFAVEDMIYLDGFGGQRVYISRDAGIVIVRTGELRPNWDDAALPNMVIEAAAE